MNHDDKIKTVLSIPSEFFQHEELEALVKSNKPVVIAYDGFEPSGRMHIAQGLLRTINTNKLTSCGFIFKFWVADWFAMLNHKLGGDLKKIRKAGELMIEIWKACGMDMGSGKVQFLWASDEINRQPDKYWSLVMDISSKFSTTRVQRCTQIMGRGEGDELAVSQMFYPVMQCADIFFLNVDICSLGLDQRKVNMLALEYCDKIKRKFKPIVVSHPMLRGLDGSDKMAKSNPDSAIFMDDEPNEVKRKINRAFCEPGNVEVNPILDYYKHIVFAMDTVMPLTLSRKVEFGGDIIVNSYDELEQGFKAGSIHPSDVKPDLIQRINRYLEPVQRHFRENPDAKKLLETVKKYAITK
jgi:tyrosyl-tRNA synthetase